MLYLSVNEKQLNKEQKSCKNFKRKYSTLFRWWLKAYHNYPICVKKVFTSAWWCAKNSAYDQKYSLIEVPSRIFGAFCKVALNPGVSIALYCLKMLFVLTCRISFSISPTIILMHISVNYQGCWNWYWQWYQHQFCTKNWKRFKEKKKRQTVRFVYDKEMDAGILEFDEAPGLSRKDNIIPGGRIHNFRHFLWIFLMCSAPKHPGGSHLRIPTCSRRCV